MLHLDYKYNLKLRLGEAISASECDITLHYYDETYAREAGQSTVAPTANLTVSRSSGVSEVVVLAGPDKLTEQQKRRVIRPIICNRDTIAHTIYLFVEGAGAGGPVPDTAEYHILSGFSLAAGQSLIFGLDGTLYDGSSSAMTVSSAATIADNVIVRGDGGARGVQGSGITVDDSNNVTGMNELTLPNTGLHLLDTNATHDLIIAPGSNLTADRTLTITTGDANRVLTMTGDASISGTNTGDQTITLTGDVTGSGTGSFAATIANDAVTNAKAAEMAALTVKLNATNATANPTDFALTDGHAAIRRGTAIVSGYTTQYLFKSASYSPVAADNGAVICFSVNSATASVSLPSIATVGAGYTITIKKISSGTGASDVLTINRNGADTIFSGSGGTATVNTLVAQFAYVRLVADTTNSVWVVESAYDFFSNTASATSFGGTDVYADAVTLTSIPPGLWLAYGHVAYIRNSATVTDSVIGISTTSGNSGTGLTFYDNALIGYFGGVTVQPMTIDNHVLNLSAATTHYLKARATYSSGTPQYAGRFSVVRIG